MEKGEYVVLGVILVGLFLFMFSTNISGLSGSAVEAPNARPYCKSICGGDTFFRQSNDLVKESYTVKVNDYFVVNTDNELAVFKFYSVTQELDSDYVNLQKVFSLNKYDYSNTPKVYCTSYNFLKIPFNFNEPLKTIPIPPNKEASIYDIIIPTGLYSVKARLFYSLLNGRDMWKLHVDLDNDGNLGGEVKIKSFSQFDVCDNVKKW